MRSLFVFLFCLSSVFAFGGAVTWNAGNLSGSFVGGSAYCIQVTAGTTTASAIAAYITSTGLSYTSTGSLAFAQKGESRIVSYITNFGSNGAEDVSGGTVGMSDNGSDLFCIVISSDGQTFSISNAFSKIAIGNESENWSPIFGANDAGDWTTGSIKQVPEPTVLALLALGVAGLVLKRKVA